MSKDGTRDASQLFASDSDATDANSFLLRALGGAPREAIAVKSYSSETPPRVTELSYGELIDSIGDLNRQFEGFEVNEATFVYVFLPPDIGTASVILSIWSRRAIYVPLSTDSPSFVSNLLKQDAGGIIVSDKSGYERLEAAGLSLNARRLENFDLLSAKLSGNQTTSPYPSIAYVIRTSGTTSTPGLGTPVSVPHTSFLTNLLAIRDRLAPSLSSSTPTVIPLLSPLTFDPSLIELFLPLLLKGTLVVIPRETIAAPSRLLPIASDCTAIFCTPSLFRRFDATAREMIISGQTCVRTLVLGGEMFPFGLLSGATIDVFNIYGTTENSVWATLWKYDGGEQALLGEPLEGTEIELRQLSNNERGDEEVFELWIRGTSRICYLPGDPVDSPLISRFTGDLVRKVDGGLVFVGRKDVGIRVKVQGRRVDLVEVAGVIRGLGNDCEVIGLDTSDGTSIAAFLLPPHPSVPALHQTLQPLLPQHALPSRYYLIPNLPTTPNGKVDTATLGQLASDTQPISPTPNFQPLSWSYNDVLATLLSLVSAITNVSLPASAADGSVYFLAEGGDSLTAALLSERLLGTLSSDDGTRNLLRSRIMDKILHGTLSDLAQTLMEIKEAGNLAALQTRTSTQPIARATASSAAPESLIPRKRRHSTDYQVLERATAHDPTLFPSLPFPPSPDWTCLWSIDMEACIDASPLVVLSQNGGTVYVGSHAGIFSAVNLDGTVKWSLDIGGRIESTACFVGEFVCFGCYDGHVYVISAEDGTVEWKFKTGDVVKCSPCPLGDDIIVGSHDRYLYRLSSGKKKVVWKTQLGAGIFARPVCYQDVVVAGTLGGTLFSFDAGSGKKEWDLDLGKPVFAGPCCSEDGTILVGTVGGTLFAVSSIGEKLWSFDVGGPIFSTPVYHNKTVVFGTHAKQIVALDTETGQPRWTFATDSPVYASVSIVSNTVIAADTNSNVHFLSLDNGTATEDGFKACDAEMYSSPVPLDLRTIVLAGRDDQLRLYRRL